jgi:hypothetical protein
MAVLAVAPWDEYVADLQPGFSLKPEDALKQAGSTTAAMERKLLDMLKVVARVATPSTSTSASDTTTSTESTDAAGETTTTRDRTRERTETEAPGTAPEFQPSLPGDKSAGALDGIEELTGQKPVLGTAALAQYNLATALMQEVKLLNRYVKDATQRNGYVPYVVRMQVSLMPTVRNAPYDAYSTISFFPPEGSEAYAGRQSLPVVIPLLVTDDMEAIMASDSAEVVRQYALAISALIRGFSASADVERYTDELVTTVTRDYNSLYSVARQTDNSIRVRMGARFHSTRRHFMVPQTHNVTLLLLAPPTVPAGSDVMVEAFTEFVDVETGKALPGGGLRRVESIVDERLRSFNLDDVVKGDLRTQLDEAAISSDYPAFETALRPCLEAVRARRHPKLAPSPQAAAADGRTIRRLWTVFNRSAVGARYTSTRFMLPRRCPCTLPEDGVGTTDAMDDGATNLVVDLRPVRNVRAGVLAARLVVKADGEDCKDPSVSIPATRVEFIRDADTLRCTFPSLGRVKHRADLVSKLLYDKDAKHKAFLQVDDRCAACVPCSSGLKACYPVRPVLVLKAPPSAEQALKLASLPALRVCGCAKAQLVVHVARGSPEGAAEVGKVTMTLTFLAKDGKTPASGIVTSAKVGDAVLPRKPEEIATNALVVPFPPGPAGVALTLELDQLSDDSVLALAAKLEGAPGDPTKRDVLIYVQDPGRDKCCPGVEMPAK